MPALMRTRLQGAVMLSVGLIVLTGCKQKEQSPVIKTDGAPHTIQAVMDKVIDPSADALWASVGTVEEANGVRVRKPQSPAEWQKLGVLASKLASGATLLKSPLPVGANGHGALADSSTPGTRTALQIRADIDRDPERFHAAAERLRLAAVQASAAIEAHDETRLLEAGASIDAACEACHHAYWYPRTPPLPLPKPDDFAKSASRP